MEVTPEEMIIFQIGNLNITGTIFFTWVVMFILVAGSWLITRKLSVGMPISRWQNMLEVIVSTIRNQIREVSQDEEPDKYIPFIGTLFIFVAVSNTLDMVPYFEPPTGSIYTPGTLALLVFFAVPYFGIKQKGVKNYFKNYIKPSPVMLPFNIIGEFSRTLSLAVRLFGNVMSGSLIVAILVGIIPLIFPIAMQALGLLIGLIQAYIFAILAMVYIASASRTQKENNEESKTKGE